MVMSNAIETVVIVRELNPWMFMVDHLGSRSRDHHRRSIFRLLELAETRKELLNVSLFLVLLNDVQQSYDV